MFVLEALTYGKAHTSQTFVTMYKSYRILLLHKYNIVKYLYKIHTLTVEGFIPLVCRPSTNKSIVTNIEHKNLLTY